MVDGDTEREGWYGVMMLWWWWWQYSTATHMFGAFDVRHLPILLQHLLQQPHIFDLETGKLHECVCLHVRVRVPFMSDESGVHGYKSDLHRYIYMASTLTLTPTLYSMCLY